MMQKWFDEAKLGIFLHWGIYSVKGIPESWSFFRGQISYHDYMAQAAGFTAENYNPEHWARTFKAAGADYAVLTAKHHDGFALWDTGVSELNVVDATPAGRDLIGPYCDALRAEGIKVGLYFSHLDWSHPDYRSVHRTGDSGGNEFNSPDGPDDPAGWEKFLAFHRAQLKELCQRYSPDLLWFDGDWERTPEQWRMSQLREQLHSWCPDVVLNSRMGGHGDYATPEQGIPIVPPSGPWEFCMTMNNSWGYQVSDAGNDKTLRQLAYYYSEVITRGGKLLLDLGPLADGTLQGTQETRLGELAEWASRNDAAIHETRAGLPDGHFAGGSTLSNDGRTLYLFCYDPPVGDIAVKGVCNEVRSAAVTGTGEELTARKIGGAKWAGIPGVLWISPPQREPKPGPTVVEVQLNGELELWRGEGGAIEQN